MLGSPETAAARPLESSTGIAILDEALKRSHLYQKPSNPNQPPLDRQAFRGQLVGLMQVSSLYTDAQVSQLNLATSEFQLHRSSVSAVYQAAEQSRQHGQSNLSSQDATSRKEADEWNDSAKRIRQTTGGLRDGSETWVAV